MQRAGRIGPYPKVNNQYDWLSNTIQKSDWITRPNGFIFSNGIICIIITQPSRILYIMHMLCENHLILTEHQMKNLVSNIESWIFFFRRH